MQEEQRKRVEEERQAHEEARRRFIEETSKTYLSFPEVAAVNSSGGRRSSTGGATKSVLCFCFCLRSLAALYLLYVLCYIPTIATT